MTKPTMWLCAQRRLRSAWAFARSNQSLRCPHEESLGPYLPIKRTAKTDKTERMPRLIGVFAGRTVTLLVLSRGGSLFVMLERSKGSHNEGIMISLQDVVKRPLKGIIHMRGFRLFIIRVPGM